MDKRLVSSLLRVIRSDTTRFPAGKAMLEFSRSYNVGRAQGASLYFSDGDKREIADILQGELGIDAATTRPEDWDDQGRAGGLSLGRNEKFSRVAVGEGRLQLKAVTGRELSVCGGRWSLPDRADLGVDLSCVLDNPVEHGCLLVVENRQTFIELWHVETALLGAVNALDPLVVFRGDASGGAQVDAVHRLIERLDLPVHAFVDYDPAGMVIAASLPRLDALVAPSVARLQELLLGHGLTDRFLQQIPAAKHSLERLESHPILGASLAAIMATGKAMPQEFFHR